MVAGEIAQGLRLKASLRLRSLCVFRRHVEGRVWRAGQTVPLEN
jgi:hypothetical protein